MTAEAAIQRRTAETGLDEFPDHDQQVVQGQQQQFTDGHHHLLLGLCQRGAQAMGTGRGILGAGALAPLGHRVAVNTVSARQRGVAHRQGRHLDLPSNTRDDASVGMATFSCGLTEAHEGSRARVRIESTQISAFFSVSYHAQQGIFILLGSKRLSREPHPPPIPQGQPPQVGLFRCLRLCIPASFCGKLRTSRVSHPPSPALDSSLIAPFLSVSGRVGMRRSPEVRDIPCPGTPAPGPAHR